MCVDLRTHVVWRVEARMHATLQRLHIAQCASSSGTFFYTPFNSILVGQNGLPECMHEWSSDPSPIANSSTNTCLHAYQLSTCKVHGRSHSCPILTQPINDSFCASSNVFHDAFMTTQKIISYT